MLMLSKIKHFFIYVENNYPKYEYLEFMNIYYRIMNNYDKYFILDPIFSVDKSRTNKINLVKSFEFY